MTIINNLNTCHYCIDTILKLNEEQLLNDIYDTEIENNEIEIAKEYIFNPKNFINLIKQLDDYQELQDLR